jgi:tetratricopeptide (TPR) repeat protein
VDLDPARDLAILQVDDLPPDTEPLALSAEGCRPGEVVHSLGNAAGEALWVYASGAVRQVYRREVNENGLRIMRYQCVQTQEPVNRGDSGGPVVNDEGQVVAVNHSILVPGAIGVGTLTTFAVDVSEVRAFLDEVRPMLQPSTADDFYRRGLRHLSRGRASTAITDFEAGLNNLPRERDTGAILIGLARAEYHAGLNREAVATLTRALGTRPGDPEILVWRGQALLKTDDAPSARDDFERVLALATQRSVSDDLLAQAYLGRATISKNDGDDASYARDIEAASRSNPQDFLAHVWLAAHLDRLGHLSDALAESDKALKIAQEELDPIKRLEILGQVHVAFRTRAHVYATMKYADDALRDYGAAVHWRMRVRPYKGTAPFVVEVGRDLERLGHAHAQKAQLLLAYAEKLPKEMGPGRPTFRERLIYVENKTPRRLVLYFKYHTLAKNNRWEWRPGCDVASSEWASLSIEAGDASLAAVRGNPIRADRIRYVVKNERNETVSDKYWSEDLVLVTPEGYQDKTQETYILHLP